MRSDYSQVCCDIENETLPHIAHTHTHIQHSVCSHARKHSTHCTLIDWMTVRPSFWQIWSDSVVDINNKTVKRCVRNVSFRIKHNEHVRITFQPWIIHRMCHRVGNDCKTCWFSFRASRANGKNSSSRSSQWFTESASHWKSVCLLWQQMPFYVKCLQHDLCCGKIWRSE